MSEDQPMQVNDGANPGRVVRVNYPGNGNNSKRTTAQSKKSSSAKSDKKVERVTTSEPVQRKKGLGAKIAETFTGDNMQTVANYVLLDVIVPQIKTMISDALTQGVERSLFGDSARRTTRPTMGSRGVNYNSISRSSTSSPVGRAGESDGSRTLSQKARAGHNFEDIILADRGEAEEVIDRLTDLVKEYDVATVSDLYDLVGITGAFTDDKWGWYDMRGSGVRRTSGGFLLILPPTEPVD